MSERVRGRLLEERILVFTPIGRSPEVLRSVLTRSGLTSRVCASMDTLVDELRIGAGAVVLVEEVFSDPPNIDLLKDAISAQPPWSELQVIVLVDPQRSAITRTQILRELEENGNVILQERPVKPFIMVSLIRGALRHRRRQYQLREALEALETANRNLEQQVEERTAHLEVSEERFRRILTEAPIPVVVVDEDGFIHIVSEMLLRTTGYRREELETLDDWFRRIHRFDESKRARARMRMSRFFEKKRTIHRQEAVITTRSGENRIWLISATKPGTFKSGKRYIVSMAVDITQQKEAERQITISRDHAEQANRAKSEFLASMSHEIRTPISGILEMTELLQKTVTGTEEREYLEMMRESAHSLISIIGEILDLSRIEAGKEELHFRKVSVHREVPTLTAPFDLSARGQGLDFRYRIATDVPEAINTDWDKVAQVIRNLLSNAVKFTPEGFIELTVAAGERKDVPDLVPGTDEFLLEFRVSDTGIGIPLGKRKDLFQGYSRIHSSVTRKSAEGTGLGLSIARRLVEFMGGTIGLEARTGGGSVFRFTVPVQTGEPEPDGVQEENPIGEASGEHYPLRVLVADDDRINRVFLRTMLEREGHRVDVTENGQEACTMFEKAAGTGADYDLVLMDIQMPVMNGMEATRKIRQLQGPGSEVPIIALTAFAMKGDEERFLDAGMNRYITKPIDVQRLESLIRELRNQYIPEQ